jgi:hypothetical protein
MNERIIHLRIKIKNLADEARSIREEARKTSGMVKWGLNDHRTGVVRPHARHNLLAYGLLRGVPYDVIERKCDEAPNFATVEKHAKQFGGDEDVIKAWVADAKAYLKSQKEQLKLAS